MHAVKYVLDSQEQEVDQDPQQEQQQSSSTVQFTGDSIDSENYVQAEGPEQIMDVIIPGATC